MAKQGLAAIMVSCGLLTSCMMVMPGGMQQPNTSGNDATVPASTNPSTAGKKVSSVRVTPDTQVISVGTSKDLAGTVSYTDGSFDGNIAWSASDDTILNVNPTSGKVTALKAGVASVVAAAGLDPSQRAMATITVRGGEVEEALTYVSPTEATLKVGETVRLSAKIRLSDGSESPNVVWTSDNKSVALVSNGLVTAVGAGTTTITVMAAGDPTKRATATITVTGS